MRKKPLIPAWAETIVPLLPLLPELVSWKSGFSSAFFGAVIFFILAVLVKLTGMILNKKQISIFFALAAASAVYACNALWELPAGLVLSLCLLGPASAAQKKYNPKISVIFLKGTAFFALAVYLSAAQEFLSGTFHLSFFQRVSGTFLLLLLPALLWPASRKLKGKLRRGPRPVLSEASL